MKKVKAICVLPARTYSMVWAVMYLLAVAVVVWVVGRSCHSEDTRAFLNCTVRQPLWLLVGLVSLIGGIEYLSVFLGWHRRESLRISANMLSKYYSFFFVEKVPLAADHVFSVREKPAGENGYTHELCLTETQSEWASIRVLIELESYTNFTDPIGNEKICRAFNRFLEGRDVEELASDLKGLLRIRVC